MYKKEHLIEQNITYELDQTGDRYVFITDRYNTRQHPRPVSFYIKLNGSVTIDVDRKDLKCFVALLDNNQALKDFKVVVKEFLKETTK